MFNAKFFDYKDFIPVDERSNLGTMPHIIYVLVASILIILLCYLFRNAKKQSIETYLKILLIYLVIQEVAKVGYETYWDLKLGYGFNFARGLPFYTCSMFELAVPFVIWGKGKVKECAIAFVTTISIFAGLTNFFLPPILSKYPVWTFSAINSLNYHAVMVFTGFFLITTKYYMPNKQSILKAYIPVFLFSLLVIPVDYFFFLSGISPDVDYMMYIHGDGAPILPAFSNWLGSYNLRIIYTLLILGSYYIIGAIFVGIFQGVFKLFKIKQESRYNLEVLCAE